MITCPGGKKLRLHKLHIPALPRNPQANKHTSWLYSMYLAVI